MKNKMLHVVICDDSSMIARKIERLVGDEMNKHNVKWSCAVYSNGLELLDSEKPESEELIFLDIEMPTISGLEVAEQLLSCGRNKNIVFVTSHENLVFNSLRYFPFYFLRKDHMEQEISDVIDQFIKKIDQNNKVFEYKIRSNVYRISIIKIGYLAYWNHNITITLLDGEVKEFRGSIKDCEKQLPTNYFFRANNGTIVNLSYCDRLEENYFVMKDGKKIQISRDRRKEAKLRFMKSWREKL